MRQALIFIAALVATSVGQASPGTVTCSTEQVGGLTQKIIVYQVGRKIYAINGQSRQRAVKRGWIDGKSVFSPERMLELLNEGLKKC